MAPSKSRKRKSADDLVIEAGAMNMGDSKRRRNLPVRAKGGEATAVPAAVSAPPGNLKVFTDEEDGEAVISAPSPVAAPKPAAPVEEEEEDSDDEAPEAVSTTRAASAVKHSAQAAQKAAQEQAAAQKRKRQQRDALFKQQAEERKKTEKETEGPVEVAAKEDENSENEGAQLDTSGRRRRVDKVQIPNLLPAEFLTDSSSEDEEEDSRETAAVRPKKRKIATIERGLSRLDRGPRDERVGSTVYRVTKKVDERMAPKLRKHAKSSKELLLKRNRPAVKSRSGFMVRK